jgi:transcriptional regulator with XRE-family HTH domain
MKKEDQNLFYSKLGETIRLERKKNKLSQDEVAEHLGFTRISIVNIEQGKQKIQLHSLIELAILFQIDVTELLAPSYVVILNTKIPLAQKNFINEIEQLDNKEIGSDILNSFMRYSYFKK